MTWNVGTAGGNKVVNAATVGTAGGNKAVHAGWIGTAGGNKLFFSSVAPFTVTADGHWEQTGFDEGTPTFALVLNGHVSAGGTAPYVFNVDGYDIGPTTDTDVQTFSDGFSSVFGYSFVVSVTDANGFSGSSPSTAVTGA